jgi:DNA (cytosine-5)-methyltransferase 1
VRCYYNEHDKKAAAWLRELMSAGAIAPGEVDERDIFEVRPNDVRGFTQCHFFAGIGGWSYALRLAGWPDERPVWTASLPCQPFSHAGQRRGTKDKRHLWPIFKGLALKCAPPTIFGEQVTSPAGRQWLDRVRADLESMGFAFGAADLCAAGVGAPHRRQRLYWLADADLSGRSKGRRDDGRAERDAEHRGSAGGNVGHALPSGLPVPELEAMEGKRRRTSRRRIEQPSGSSGERVDDSASQRTGQSATPEPRSDRPDNRLSQPASADSGLGDAGSSGSGRNSGAISSAQGKGQSKGLETRRVTDKPIIADTDSGTVGNAEESNKSGSWPSERQHFAAGRSDAWSNFELIPCRDGKARRIESGTFPLAYGIPGRVGLLRGYGNAIVPQVAAEFIIAAQEALKQ